MEGLQGAAQRMQRWGVNEVKFLRRLDRCCSRLTYLQRLIAMYLVECRLGKLIEWFPRFLLLVSCVLCSGCSRAFCC